MLPYSSPYNVSQTRWSLRGLTAALALGWVLTTQAASQFEVLTPLTTPQVTGSTWSAGVTLAADGSLYGTMTNGTFNGAAIAGAIYKRDPFGNVTFPHIFTLDNIAGAVSQEAEITIGPDGTLYGVADGGAFGQGAIYKVGPFGDFSVLHNFHDDNLPNVSGGTTVFGGLFPLAGVSMVRPVVVETLMRALSTR
jgi:uncharacterized repeat protein (TIGR03803 family)